MGELGSVGSVGWLTLDERRELGRATRKEVPRSSHADWSPAAGRPDPLNLIRSQDRDRLPWLVPVRHGRMLTSAFAFYRGTAVVMAADLATTPVSGLGVQLCGDAHLANFGAYASPERQLVVDANDFDETLPGPWEWDVKRLAASFTIAARHNTLTDGDSRMVTSACLESYRLAMADYAEMRTLDLWYDHLAAEDALGMMAPQPTKSDLKQLEHFEARARSKDSLQALRKLAVEVDGQYRIRHDPPVLLSLRDLPAEIERLEGEPVDAVEIEALVYDAFASYKETLEDSRRHLLDRFKPVDVGLKVVGVGSVGTRCLIMLLEGRDRGDPLFLQVKEAGDSVLEEYLAPSVYDNQGQRVVEGQRLMQAVSDIFLGWTHGRAGRDFYVRQLRDWKASMVLENRTRSDLERYARLCGRILARGHARSGDPVAISAYLGKSRSFDIALTEFAAAYATQAQRDFDEFTGAIADGALVAAREG